MQRLPIPQKRVYRPAQPHLRGMVAAMPEKERAARLEAGLLRVLHAASEAELAEGAAPNVGVTPATPAPTTHRIYDVAVGVGATYNDAFPNFPAGGYGAIDMTGTPPLIVYSWNPFSSNISQEDIQQNALGICWADATLGGIAGTMPSYIPTAMLWPDRDTTGAIIPNRYIWVFRQNLTFVRVHTGPQRDGAEDRVGPTGNWWVASYQSALAFFRLGDDNLQSLNGGSSNNDMWWNGLFTDPNTDYRLISAPWQGAGFPMPTPRQTSDAIRAALRTNQKIVTHSTMSTVAAPYIASHCQWFCPEAEQPPDVGDADPLISIHNPWNTGILANPITTVRTSTLLANGYIDVGVFPPVSQFPIQIIPAGPVTVPVLVQEVAAVQTTWAKIQAILLP